MMIVWFRVGTASKMPLIPIYRAETQKSAGKRPEQDVFHAPREGLEELGQGASPEGSVMTQSGVELRSLPIARRVIRESCEATWS